MTENYGKAICNVLVVMDTKFDKNILVFSNVINSEKNIVLYTKKNTHTHLLRYMQYNIQDYYAYPS